jgi:hypothetical protein
VTRSRSFVAVVFALLLADVAAAQSGERPAEKATASEPVGGVVLGDPHWRRSHFSANVQGYSYASHLVPRSWAGGGGTADRPPNRSNRPTAIPGYRGKRYYDALSHRLDRRYARDRYEQNRRYARDRYEQNRRYARDRHEQNRRYARDRYFRNRRDANQRY